MRAQDAVRTHERLDRRADGDHVASFKRNRERNVIEFTLVRKVLRGNFREILEREGARLEVVKDEHIVVANQRIPFEIQIAVQNVERVFRRVRRLVVVGKGALRRRAHDQLQTAFRRQPLQHVGPAFLAETHDDRFFRNAALETLVLFRGKDGFKRPFRFKRNCVPFFFWRAAEPLRALRHQFVDALALLFRKTDSSRDRRIKQPGIALLRIKIGRQFHRHRRLRFGRVRIRKRFVHSFCERGGAGRILGGDRYLGRAFDAHLFERGLTLFRSRFHRGRGRGFRRRGRLCCSGRGGNRRFLSEKDRGMRTCRA